MDHISALLALLLEGPYCSSSIDWLHKSYTPEESLHIWTAWEPQVRPPPSPILAEGTLARDRVMAMLRMDYTTPANAAGDA
jgi:hypothetical protein